MFGNMYAISIDLCSHSDLFMIMNHYVLSQTETIEEQVEKIAEKDVAPLVRVCIGEVKD